MGGCLHRRFWVRRIAPAILLLGAIVVVVLYFLGTGADNLDADVQEVEVVQVGDPFNLDVLLENPTRSEQTIVSFALETELLATGLRVQSSIPNFRTTRENADWTEFVFSLGRRALIAPGSDGLVRVTFVATQPGNFSGELVVWFNNQLRAQYIPFEFQVDPASGPAWLGG